MRTKMEICKLIVNEGKSKVLNRWQQATGKNLKDEFLKELEWLLADPAIDEYGRYINGARITRGLACTREGELVRLKKTYDPYTGIIAFYRQDDKSLWSNYFGERISPDDRI